MRSLEETKQRWDSLFRDNGTLVDLQQAINSERGASLCNEGLRSVCWKAFLLLENLDRKQWPQKLTDTRCAYSALRDHFLKYIEHPDDLESSIDPLADDKESPWQTLRQDETIRAEISQDVERCLQEQSFFRETSTKAKMVDILFIYAKLNPDLGYRQGMHELLAPILWVLDQDAIDKSFSADANASTPATESLMVQVLDSNYVEHDAFSLFCAVMQITRIYYEHSDVRSTGSQTELAPIVNRCLHVHGSMLVALDLELADHLQSVDILPQIFLTRWMRLLFGREFPFEDVLSIWDALFANGLRCELIELVCVAMLLRIRWQLLDSDYSGALSLLLRYPSPRPHAPQTFVHDAIYLEQNATSERGGFIVAKYSGKPLGSAARRPSRSQKSTLDRKSQSRNDSRDINASHVPGQSPARNNPKILENILHDVSEGLQRRTELWGVAKVVRGAMSEARKNIQTIQSEASLRATRAGMASPSSFANAPWTHISKVDELRSRVEQLENRNKVLGTILKETLDGLRSHMSTSDRADVSMRNVVMQAMDKFQAVQTCLEDSSTPIVSSGNKAQPASEETDCNDKPHIQTQSSNPTTDDTKQPPQSLDLKKIQSASSGLSNESEVEESIDSKSIGPGSGSSVPATLRPRSRGTRTSLADSGFSWMVEGSRPLSRFVTPASAPPELSRQSDPKSKHGGAALFGEDDGQKQLSGELGDLPLSSLRGSKRHT